MNFRSIYTARALAALFCLLLFGLLPKTALSVQLFEGNLGFDGDWLYVLDSTAMGDRVYWYDLGTDVTYRVQFVTTDDASIVVEDIDGITTNYVVPDLDPGSYYFQVRAIDSLGAVVSESDAGLLDVVVDQHPPIARILSPRDRQTFTQGDTISIELEVSDDTLLHLARFTIDGDYAGLLGLKTENQKLKPSFGTARTVTFDYAIPTKGKAGPLEISVAVSDVMHNTVRPTIVIDTLKAGAGGRAKQSR
jgi:hypothetical protein